MPANKLLTPPSRQVRKPQHDVRMVATSQLKPAPENDELYHPIDPADPNFQGLVKSVGIYGVFEPLVVTLDDWIISGHRRHAAAIAAGRPTVPCRREPFRKADDPARFRLMLRETNRQRVKTLDERTREAVIDTNPEDAHQVLLEHRRQASRLPLDAMIIHGTKVRSQISGAKTAFLAAVQKVLNELCEFWPITLRNAHYRLLNDPPLRNSNDPASTYANDKQSYKDLSDLLIRARIAGLVPLDAIDDGERAVVVWNVSEEPGAFVTSELDGFLKGYWRNLMQSQPNHVEIVAEKNTVLSILKPIAAEYTIPLTTGKGYCSYPPRRKLAERFKASGKDKLILLMLSDHDPDGEEISASFARSLRDDFCIPSSRLHPVKVAINAEHVEQFKLPTIMSAKKSSVHHAKFTKRHGNAVHELEALTPKQLQQVLREAIDSVIDIDAFNAEIDAEKRDAAHLAGFLQHFHQVGAQLGEDRHQPGVAAVVVFRLRRRDEQPALIPIHIAPPEQQVF